MYCIGGNKTKITCCLLQYYLQKCPFFIIRIGFIGFKVILELHLEQNYVLMWVNTVPCDDGTAQSMMKCAISVT